MIEEPVAAGEVAAVESDVLDGEGGEEPFWVGLRFGNDVVAVVGV